MKCPNCGEAELKKTAKFCSECGQSLKECVVHEAQAKDIESSEKGLKQPSSHVESLPGGKLFLKRTPNTKILWM